MCSNFFICLQDDVVPAQQMVVIQEQEQQQNIQDIQEEEPYVAVGGNVQHLDIQEDIQQDIQEEEQDIVVDIPYVAVQQPEEPIKFIDVSQIS
jgi:hypothetical protein